MKTAIFPGSFDPITNGHLDILKRSLKIFDKIIIAVAYNCQKKGFLPIETRQNLIKECVKDIPNVEVAAYDGLTVDFAKKHNADFIIRGIRNSKDFEYEQEIEGVNKILNNKIETVYLHSNPEYNFVSSSAVKEILNNNGDISDFIPEPVYKYISGMKH